MQQKEETKMGHAGVALIIPTYRPDGTLRKLLERIRQQTVQPSKIVLINTEQTLFQEDLIKGFDHVEVVHIAKEAFDHGGTRHAAACMVSEPFLLFMTMDAVPADTHLIASMLEMFEQKGLGGREVCAVYARQLPRADCSILERYTRSFNYGETSCIKTKDDLQSMGIKTFFCSNVCAMYRRSTYEELGGFERHTIFNEDMIFAGKLIFHDRAVAYCARARVIHSHNYGCMEQFHRNFDLGVSQAEHPELFEQVRSENEGMRMVKQTARWLVKTHHAYLLPKLVLLSASKLVGYRLGKQYRNLPAWLVKRCTMNQSYWR